VEPVTLVFLIVMGDALICSGLCAFVGREKGRGEFNWLMLGFFLGIFALIAVAGVPALGKKEEDDGDESEDENEKEDDAPVSGAEPDSRGKFNWGRKRIERY